MKRFFLIPLMACFTCVMAWGTEIVVNDFATLKTQLSASGTADVVKLGQDIAYPTNGSDLLNIERSLTLDGQGHKISGYGNRGGQPNVISINYQNSSYVTVELKNLDIYSTEYRPLETRGYLTKLTLDNVNITSTGGSYNPQGLTIGGTQTDEPYGQLVIKDSKINVGNSGYPVIFWNPTAITLTNSDFKGYCALYFKSGSANCVVNADACNFDAPNVHTYAGGWNNFGVFTMEDGNITINLHNCGMNSEETGFAKQGMILAEVAGCVVNISGDNSHINGKMVLMDDEDDDPGYWLAFLALTGDLSITGGTYSVDPSHYGPFNPFTSFGSQAPTLPNEDMYANFVPEGYEVQEIKQGDVTLYRVVKKAASYVDPGTSETVLYNLNDAVETAAEGENPVTSFDLSTGTEMKLDEDREVTTAGYVQVKDNGSSQATVVKVGTTATADPTQKVDQTLVINNGLDVQGNSKVEVQAGSTLIVGEGGINTEDPENIVLNVTEEEGASLLLDPTITINKNPELTVKLTVNSKQLSASPWTYVYQRFAIPVMVGVAPTVDYTGSYFEGDALYSYVFQWNGYGWEACSSWTALEPFKGYQLANNAAAAGAVYTFTGQLVGNEDSEYNFPTGGFDFFGNSHLAPIYIDSLLKPYENLDVEASVWLYNYDSKNFEAITSEEIADGFAFATEIKPMDGFILNYHGASGAAKMSYASAIWGNPKFDAAIGRPSQQNPAPARNRVEETLNRAIITVTAENGQADKVKLVEKERYSAEFENGSDASKFMLATGLSLYASTEAGDLERVATNDLMGTLMSFRSGEGTTYTLTMSNVLGEDYAIRDNVTGQLIELAEGATYTFTQNAYTSVPARFEIVAAAKMPTAIENVEEAAKATGIYTITGQYLGRDFSNLPSGVYIVNGVKIVK